MAAEPEERKDDILAQSAATSSDTAPVLIAFDNDWVTAQDWSMRVDTLSQLLNEAKDKGYDVALWPTAQYENSIDTVWGTVISAQDALTQIEVLKPTSWPADYTASAEAFEALSFGQASQVFWLHNGVARSDETHMAFYQALQSYGDVKVFSGADINAEDAVLIKNSDRQDQNGALSFALARKMSDGPASYTVQLRQRGGRILDRVIVDFLDGEVEIKKTVSLPDVLLDRVTSLHVEGQETAGGVLLRSPLASPKPAAILNVAGQPVSLLNDQPYIHNAVSQFVPVVHVSAETLFDQSASVIFWSRTVPLSQQVEAQLAEWVSQGGMLVRFTGGVEQNDLYSPVPSVGQRVITPSASPLSGLDQITDLRISKLVLPEDPDMMVWAQLSDGVPLVSQKSQGEGQVVDIHTALHPAWSNLGSQPDLFVPLMQQIVGQAKGVQLKDLYFETPLQPQQSLNAAGQLGKPPETAGSLSYEAFQTGQMGPAIPPGYYGSSEMRLPYNLSDAVEVYEASVFSSKDDGAGQYDVQPYVTPPRHDWGTYALLLTTALLSGFLASRNAQSFQRKRPSHALNGGPQ